MSVCSNRLSLSNDMSQYEQFGSSACTCIVELLSTIEKPPRVLHPQFLPVSAHLTRQPALVLAFSCVLFLCPSRSNASLPQKPSLARLISEKKIAEFAYPLSFEFECAGNCTSNAMMPRALIRSQRLITVACAVFVALLFIGTAQRLQHSSTPTWPLAFWTDPTLSNPTKAPSASAADLSTLTLPKDYLQLHRQSSACEHRLGLSYLEDLRHGQAGYCSGPSPSQLTCFHSQTADDKRVDSFCIGQNATFESSNKRFQMHCDLVEPRNVETGGPALSLDRLHSYWYDTGPKIVVDKFIQLQAADRQVSLPSTSDDDQTFTILVKREGAYNLWHSLMEIMSLSMTLDVLQMSPIDPKTEPGRPFLRPKDSINTQVIILDENDEGPYFDLWRLFAKKPTIRVAELSVDMNVGNIIIPLVGGSNPVWQSDWQANDCDHSDLLRTFSLRVLQHLEILVAEEKKEEDPIVVTFIDRRGTRKFIDAETHTSALQDRYSHARIQVVDFAELSFSEQVQIVHNSDVLAGVHGAGLTHALWLKQGSSVVEILPKDFMHKGFRNLAGALGHTYFSTHGTEAGMVDANWQQDDVALEQDRFLELMDVAIKGVYNKASHNFDINDRLR